MAKGKHSAALFEVIKNSKPERAAQSLLTPKWWFKGRPSEGVAPAPVIPAVPAAAPEPVSLPDPTVRPIASRSAASRAEAARSSAVHLDYDKHRKEVTLRLRYTTLLVSAFGVCVLIGIAYVVGRHLAHGPTPASAGVRSNADQLIQQQPVQHQVADVTKPKTPARPTGTDAPATHSLTQNTRPLPLRPTGPASLIPASAETRMPRTIGLNYAIVQTYPPEEIAAAEAARDFLTKNGIPCTIEKTDYVRNPNWVCLVGTAGFTKISSSDFKSYVDAIIQLGAKFPTSHFDRFRPAAYKWKG